MLEAIYNKELSRKLKRVKKDTITMVFLDTKDRIDVQEASSKELFKHKNAEYVINKDCWVGDCCFYHSQIVEPLTLTASKKGFEYVPSTEKFAAIYHNKVLRQLMYVQEKNLLIYLLIGVGAAILLTVMNIYYTTQILNILQEFGQVAIDQGVMLK